MGNKILLGFLISWTLTNSRGYGENHYAPSIGVKTQNLAFTVGNTFLNYENSGFRQPTGAPPISSNKAYIEDPTATTYILEGIGSLAGGTAGGGAAFLVLAVPLFALAWASEGSSNTSGRYDLLGILLCGMGAGVSVGSASGTWLAGKLTKQEGSFGNAFKGACIGVIATIALGYGISQVHLSEDFAPDPIPAILAVSMITLVLAPVPIATVIGYNNK